MMMLSIIVIFLFTNPTKEQKKARCYLNAQGITASFASKDDRYLLSDALRLLVIKTEIEKTGSGVEVMNPPTEETYNLREKEGVCVDGFRIHHNPRNDAYYRNIARLYSGDSLIPIEIFVIDHHAYRETFKIDVPGLYNNLFMTFSVMSYKEGLKPLPKLSFPELKEVNQIENYCLMLVDIYSWAMLPLGKLSESEFKEIKDLKYLQLVYQLYSDGNIKESKSEYTAWLSKCSLRKTRKPIFVVNDLSLNSRINARFLNSNKAELFNLVLVPKCDWVTLRILTSKKHPLFVNSKLFAACEAEKRDRKSYIRIGARRFKFSLCGNPDELNLVLKVKRFGNFEANLGYTPERSDLEKGIVFYRPPTQINMRENTDDSVKCYQ